MDDFLGLAQGPRHQRRHVRRTLFHALDEVLPPLDKGDTAARNEVLSLKKLDAGDCKRSTCRTLLGWVVDTANMTLSPPPPLHQVERIQAILKEISPTQKRISVTNGTRYWRNSAP